MRKVFPSQWTEFQNCIAAMDDNSSAHQILNAILSWLRRHSTIFLKQPFAAYSFDRFLALEEFSYPVEISAMHGTEFLHFKKIIGQYAARDKESIARYLRDTLETLIVMELDRQCPRCDRWGMNVYKKRYDGRMVFECRQCGFAIYEDGSMVGPSELTFASKEDLHRAGLI